MISTKKQFGAALAVCLALMAALALAASIPIKLSWTIPATRENGQPLKVAEIKGYEISWSVDGGKPSVISVPGGATTTTSVTLSLLARAQPWATSWSIVAIDTTGLPSKPSASVDVSIDVPLPPSPPAAVPGFSATRG